MVAVAVTKNTIFFKITLSVLAGTFLLLSTAFAARQYTKTSALRYSTSKRYSKPEKPTATSTLEKYAEYGDLNHDGKVDWNDRTLFYRMKETAARKKRKK